MARCMSKSGMVLLAVTLGTSVVSAETDPQLEPFLETLEAQIEQGWLRAEPINYSRGFGLGGLFSTVDDLVAFDTALRDGTILEPETVSRMEQAFELPDGEPAEHGLGWALTERRGTRFVHHGGGINGWRSYIVAIPDRNVFVAVLSNRGEERTPVAGLAMMVADRIAALP